MPPLPKRPPARGGNLGERRTGGDTAPLENDHLDETDIRFQEAFGERLFRQNKRRAVIDVKSP